jgi:hypothetical protein
LSERLQGVTIENRPAINLLKQHDSLQTLHYVDPPYPYETRNKRWRGKAYRHEMCDDEHRKLAHTLRGLKGMIILSGYRCSLYNNELYSDWRCVERQTLGTFGANCRRCRGGGRGAVMKPSAKNPPSDLFVGAILRGYDKARSARGTVRPADIWDYIVRECLQSSGGFAAMFAWDKSKTKENNRIGTIMDCISGGFVPGLRMGTDARGRATVEKQP